MHSITITLTEAAQRAAILAGEPAQARQTYDVPAGLLPRLLALPWTRVDGSGEASCVLPAAASYSEARHVLHGDTSVVGRAWVDAAPELRAAVRPADASAAIDHADRALVTLRAALAAVEGEELRYIRQQEIPEQIRDAASDRGPADYWARKARKLGARAGLTEEETERHAAAVLAAHAAGVERRRVEDAEAAAQAERRRVEDAAREARQAAKVAYLREWILAHGSPDQRERVEAGDGLGLLPEDEAIDAVREAVFAPLAELPRYEDLDRRALDVEDDSCDHDPAYESYAAEDVTPDAWAALKRVRALAPEGAVCTVQLHRAYCDRRGCDAAVERDGILVQIEVHPGLTLSREYAAE